MGNRACNYKAELSWKLIEWRMMYYYPDLVHESRHQDYEISDYLYDKREMDYLRLCKLFDTPAYTVLNRLDETDLSGQQELDFSRPSVQLVLKKLSSPKEPEMNELNVTEALMERISEEIKDLREHFHNEEEKELNNVVEFKPKLVTATGGPTSSGNWLKDMEIGTVFFVSDKHNPRAFDLGLFRLMNKEGPNDKVISLQSPDLSKPIAVNPTKFINMYECYHIVGVISPEAETTGASLEELIPPEMKPEEHEPKEEKDG